jgi:hypothetical protein
VGRFINAIYPVTTASPTWLQPGAFTSLSGAPPVRGIVVGQLDVRQGAVTATAITQGASNDLPTNANASMAVSAPDAHGWSDLAAFGGHNANNLLTADLFYTTHAYPSGDTPHYVWHRLPNAGAVPLAREGAAVAFNGGGTHLYVVGGRSGSTTFSDVRVYELATQKWSLPTLSTTIAERYDAGLAVLGNVLYVGGGATTTGASLGDLIRVDMDTHEVTNYGNALPLGALPSLSFDDHGDGLVYGGGYYGTTWYADVWTVRFVGTQTITSFVRNFGADGMAATPNYAVVADLYHGMFWGVPGHATTAAQPEIRFLRDGVATIVKQNDTGGAALLAARSASPDVSPARVLRNAPRSGTPIMVRTTTSARVTRTAANGAPQ